MIGFVEFAILVVCLRAVQQPVVAWLKRRRATPDRIPSALAERLAKLEQAVDVSANEIELIGESQRFLMKARREPTPDAVPDHRPTPPSVTPI
jgi:hypothetical protein